MQSHCIMNPYSDKGRAESQAEAPLVEKKKVEGSFQLSALVLLSNIRLKDDQVS